MYSKKVLLQEDRVAHEGLLFMILHGESLYVVIQVYGRRMLVCASVSQQGTSHTYLRQFA